MTSSLERWYSTIRTRSSRADGTAPEDAVERRFRTRDDVLDLVAMGRHDNSLFIVAPAASGVLCSTRTTSLSISGRSLRSCSGRPRRSGSPLGRPLCPARRRTLRLMGRPQALTGMPTRHGNVSSRGTGAHASSLPSRGMTMRGLARHRGHRCHAAFPVGRLTRGGDAGFPEPPHGTVRLTIRKG